ncbi:zinc ribbon domain-containing protein [Deinococcus ficus]|uniref:zinc ribbon domain-containing protein n=1 Tax=Deinococcus ficus TaxID=317577 RepID=UPI0003B3F507|nr:zinc ribbon domain-containing protein [Deinococcus ficus]
MPIIHAILPIDQLSYPTIDRLFQDEQLTRRPSQFLQHNRARGILYHTPPCSVTARNDTTLQVGEVTLQVALYRLPTAEQQALIAASPAYHQYVGLHDLSVHLRSPATSQGRAISAIEAVVERGRHPARHASLTLPDALFQARWQTDRLILQQLAGQWFVVLHFDFRCTRLDLITRRTEVGLDLGARPLIYACTADDDQFTTESCHVPIRGLRGTLLEQVQESPDLLTMLDRITTAWHRRELQRILDRLCREAAVVYAEDLSYDDMFGPYVNGARRNGVLDFHEAWLHNRLQTVGIPMEKIDPRGTSRRCSFCKGHPYGQRHGSTFTCRHCKCTVNAHWNAARNVLREGREKSVIWHSKPGTVLPTMLPA